MISYILVVFLGVLVAGQAPPAQTAIQATSNFAGYNLNAAGNQYMTQSSAPVWSITLVSGNLYTITNGGQYISPKVGAGGYNTDGASASYNQYTLTRNQDGTWFIFSPYLQSYNGYGYLCVEGTPYGPYCPSFCTSPYSFIFTAAPPPPSTPAPTSGPVMVKALKDSVTGYYIAAPSNPYLSSSPVQYTIEPVAGAPGTYTMRVGFTYVSAEVEAGGFNSQGPSFSYNQFQMQQQSDGRYIIYSQYLYDYNGYGWLTSQSTPYGPYLSFSNSPSGKFWTLV